MSWDLHRHRPSDAGGKKPSRHISRLSTNMSLDESPEILSHKLAPLTTRNTDRRPTTKTVKLRFAVESKGKSAIGIVGNIMELGQWDANSRVMLETRPGQFPLWTSREITIFCPFNDLEIEYRYVSIEPNGSCRPESCPENRKLELKLMFTTAMSVVIRDTLSHHENHSIDSRQGLPMLMTLSKDGNLYEHVRNLCDYMTNKAEHVTLKDYIALAHFFRYIVNTQKESDSMHMLQVLLKLTSSVLQQSTDEIEPIVRDICSNMAACSLPLRKVMQKIIDRAAVESNRVPLGCEAPEIFELVGMLLNDSSEEYMARALTINSVRRTLQKVRDRSSRPELLMLYDILLEETQFKYVEERFSTAGAANLVSEIHKLTIVLESLELSNVCSYELRSLRSSLDSIWRQHEESKEYFESIKGVLLDLLDTALSWLSKYACPEAFQNLTDYIGIKDTLAGIGAKYVRLLMPIMSKALKYLDRLMQVEHYIPLCKGTAVGKIVRLRSLAEVPSAYAAVIAILSESPNTHVVPESVKALIILMDIDFDSKLLSYCHSRKVVLAVASKKRIPEHLEHCVQVHVFDDCIEFL